MDPFDIEMNGWLIYLSSLFFFLLLGYYVLDYLIIEELEVKNKGPIVFFCSIFAFSILYLELILFEILKLGSEEYLLGFLKENRGFS